MKPGQSTQGNAGFGSNDSGQPVQRSNVRARAGNSTQGAQSDSGAGGDSSSSSVPVRTGNSGQRVQSGSSTSGGNSGQGAQSNGTANSGSSSCASYEYSFDGHCYKRPV
jgi:hypothetical protein